MSRITVLGGTGYAGAAIVAEAARRGHQVTAVARRRPADPVPEVTYVAGSVEDEAVLAAAADADVIVVALAPRGPLAGRVRPIVGRVAELAQARGVRLGVVCGAGSLLAGPGGPRILDGAGFPPAFHSEAAEMAAVLDDLLASDAGLDWFSVSPALGFGAHNPGTARGVYRVGTDFPVVDDAGASDISAPDFALAILDEIETPSHRRRRFTVGY
jgi:putative NADH-flavin reductase